MVDRSRLLDFKAGHIDRLPVGFDSAAILEANAGLNVICGPGDYVHSGLTNLEQFKVFDVFCCFGDDSIPKNTVNVREGGIYSYTSVDENLEYLNTNKLNKLLCIIDITNKEQINNFAELFKGMAILVTQQDGHSPIFPPGTCFTILQPGGIVVLRQTDRRIWPNGSKDGPATNMSREFYRNTYWKNQPFSNTSNFICSTQTYVLPGETKPRTGKVCTRRDEQMNLGGGPQRKRMKTRSIKKKRTHRTTLRRTRHRV